MINNKLKHYSESGSRKHNMLWAYSLDCTFFSLIRLTAKILRRIVASDSCPLATYTPSMEITMRDFLIGANETKKRTLKRLQLRFPG